MSQKQKKHLTLNIDSEIAQRAVDDPNIKVSELTLHAHILTTEIEDKKKIYQGYRELFNLMLPLLQKFKVKLQQSLILGILRMIQNGHQILILMVM